LDFDDTSHGHPGAVIVPTALAVGEARDSSGEDVLGAVLLGYEIAGRLGAASRPSAQRRLTTWGTGAPLAVAGAAVTARLLRLDVGATAHALALATCSAPAPSVRQSVYGQLGPSMAKNTYAAAATAGMVAAYQAQHGVVGPRDVLDGASGFARLAGSDRWDLQALLAGWFEHFQVDQVASKPYPCCRKIHASLDAVLAVRDQHGVDVSEITGIVLRSRQWATSEHFAQTRPSDVVAAQFSAPYAVAAALSGHPPGPEWFDPDTMRDAAVLGVAERVDLVTASDLVPDGWAGVSLQTARGVFDAETHAARGDPRNPLHSDDIERKFRHLAEPVLGSERASVVVQAVQTLSDAPEVSGLTGQLRSSGPI
jgi:2-methylcitrate dehydratase PrpD